MEDNMKNMESIKTRIQDELSVPDSDISGWQSDLYILYTEDRYKWLKDNLEPQNIEVKISDVKGQSWYGKKFIVLPFMRGQ
jgi:hypothetical protein